ncbi:hypothetical protein OEZ85_012693 [Tetradesmus obliquus]|uniref:Uncharacterized protein n=1 Tax=Tetradesmus obliquus TaxID=3088 RepID=A0ABY8U692_TETOB|nr:hypothetical protein OEZ85_012693 [Tetradesmus obliquus]
MLPTPDVVLHERILLCENRINEQDAQEDSRSAEGASVCGVLHLAAQKAVGCGGQEALAEPALFLSPDCKTLAVKEPLGRNVCLLSAHDGFKEISSTFVPLPVTRDGEVAADVVLSCSWSPDSRLLLVACRSSAVYLVDESGALVTHWDATWPWAQLQLLAACHGPGNSLLLLTSARVLFLVGHGGPGAAASGSQQQQLQQQAVLAKFSVKRYHNSVRALGYDDKTGLVVLAGDGSSSSSSSNLRRGSSSSSSGQGLTSADAFAAEGVTVSAWQLQEQQLTLKFALGRPQAGPGLLAAGAAGLLGVDTAGAAAAAATRWSLAFSPLLEYAALLTGLGSVYILSLSEGSLADPAADFAGRAAAAATSSSSSGSSILDASTAGLLGPKSVPLTPAFTSAAAAGSGSGSASGSASGAAAAAVPGNRSVAWWGPRVLAVAAADGRVALARLPGSVNVLGAAPARFAPGSRAVANQSGERGLIVVEPITAAAAAAAAAALTPGAAAAAAASQPTTALEAAFSADASAAVGVSAMLAGRRAAALGSNDGEGLGFGSSNGSGCSTQGAGSATGEGLDAAALKSVGGMAGLLARGLGVADEAAAAAAAAAGGGLAGSSFAGWRLVLLSECTPQQLVQAHLRSHDWGSAFYISRAYGLDADVVYRARWSASPVSRASISDNLPKLRDRRAAVAECLSRIAPDYESARLLISYGLRETAKWAAPPAAVAAAAAAAAAAAPEFATPGRVLKHSGSSSSSSSSGATPGRVPLPSPGGLTGVAAAAGASADGAAADLSRLPAAAAAEVGWWRLQRLKLLAAIDRLELAMALNRRSYDPSVFEALRHEDIRAAAAALAATGHEFERLRLQQQLLAAAGPGAAAAADGDGGGAAVLGGVRCGPSDQQITEWFAARALRMDAASGQLTSAQQLLELAVSKGYANFTVSLGVNLGVNATWLSAGLLPQLMACLGAGSSSSSSSSSATDLAERVLPLLACYPHQERSAALHQLLLHLVTGCWGGHKGWAVHGQKHNGRRLGTTY